MKALESTPARLALFSVIALVLVWPILDIAAHTNEFRDAQVISLYEHAAVDTVKRFGQWPLWNPYYCGGLDGLGAPQSRFGSPGFLLSLIFGVERSEPILVFVLALLGMEGMFRWLHLRSSALVSTIVAPVFACSGHFSVAIFRGWTNFFGFEIVPWILFGVVLSAQGKLRGIWITALAFTFLIGFGGTYAAPLVAVAMLLEGLRALWDLPKSMRRRGVVMLLASAIFSISISAFRLWPIAETLYAAPRIMAGTPANVSKTLFEAMNDALALKDDDITMEGSFFVGSWFFAVVALGLSDRKGAKSMSIALIFFWAAGGYARRTGPFPLLRELPIFEGLRYPERFLWLAIVFASEPAARALETIPRLGDGKKWRHYSFAVLSAALAWTVISEIRTFSRIAGQRTLGGRGEVSQPDPFHQMRGNRWLAMHGEALGQGSLSCWEAYPVPESPLLRADLPAEEYVATAGTGVVKRVSWTPNEIVLDVTLAVPGLVRVNQNWHQGWESSVGTIVSEQGLLAIDLPPGTNQVKLSYRPLSAIGGGLVSGSALLALLLLSIRRHRGRVPFSRGMRVASVVATIVPFGVGGIAYARSDQPHAKRIEPRNADQSPIVIEEIPGNAAPIHAHFSGGLRLDAARITPPDERHGVGIDLYLVREGTIAKDVAMFVNLERRKHETTPEKKITNLRRDSQVIGGSYYLGDIPRDRVVHDSFGVGMVTGASGVWDVWVSFGHVSGKQGRWSAQADTTVDKGRVLIGSFSLP